MLAWIHLKLGITHWFQTLQRELSNPTLWWGVAGADRCCRYYRTDSQEEKKRHWAIFSQPLLALCFPLEPGTANEVIYAQPKVHSRAFDIWAVLNSVFYIWEGRMERLQMHFFWQNNRIRMARTGTFLNLASSFSDPSNFSFLFFPVLSFLSCYVALSSLFFLLIFSMITYAYMCSTLYILNTQHFERTQFISIPGPKLFMLVAQWRYNVYWDVRSLWGKATSKFSVKLIVIFQQYTKKDKTT